MHTSSVWPRLGEHRNEPPKPSTLKLGLSIQDTVNNPAVYLPEDHPKKAKPHNLTQTISLRVAPHMLAWSYGHGTHRPSQPEAVHPARAFVQDTPNVPFMEVFVALDNSFSAG